MALSGQFYLNSDWIPGLPAERLDVIKRTIPAHHATARPVDYFDSALPQLWIVTDNHGPVRRDVLGLYNWDNDEQTIRVSPTRTGLDSSKTYFGYDFWADAPVPTFSGETEFSIPRQSCRVIALRASEGHPVLVSTSRHVTQGIIDVSNEQWSKDTLSGTSEVIGGDPYELRVAGLREGARHWGLRFAVLSGPPADPGASIEIGAARENEPGWARAVIRTDHTQRVRWVLRFTSVE